MQFRRIAALVIGLCAIGVGCDDDKSPKSDGGGGGGSGGVPTPAAPTAAGPAKPGYFTGRITMADGKPITTPGVTYRLSINGVSGPGERVGFNPNVNPDGTFSQKLPDGIYHMPYGTLKVPFEGKTYTLKLEAVNPVNDRESQPGIVQNFVWKLTGAKPVDNPDINNHTHWYGVSTDLSWQSYRNDIKGVPPKLPAGTKLIVTLKPLTKLIDGSEGKTLTVERTFDPDALTQNDDLNDLPPANYEVSGVAKLPDGSSKPMLMMGKGDYPNFKPSTKMIIEPDATMEHYFTAPLGWVTD
jgi:hypothetical protein